MTRSGRNFREIAKLVAISATAPLLPGVPIVLFLVLFLVLAYRLGALAVLFLVAIPFGIAATCSVPFTITLGPFVLTYLHNRNIVGLRAYMRAGAVCGLAAATAIMAIIAVMDSDLAALSLLAIPVGTIQGMFVGASFHFIERWLASR